jgi:C-terminal processing protease CtpA/Prc
MVKASYFIASLLSLTLTAEAQIESALKTKLISEMDYIGNIYERGYGPKVWKEKHIQWNLSQELDKAKKGISDAQSVQEYRKAAAGFFISMEDYHVSYGFYSTERAFLPLLLKTVQGKTIIVDIDRKQLSETSFPYQVGDEITAMDAQSIVDLKKELTQDMKTTAPLTDSALGDLMLTARSARRNLVVPRNTVTLSLIRAGEAQVRSHQINWAYTPEKLPGYSKLPTENPFFEKLNLGPFGVKKPAFDFSKANMLTPILSSIVQSAGLQDSAFEIGAKKSFLPDLGSRIWETDASNTFDAYIYQNEKNQLIGVIRIPSYTPSAGGPKAAAEFGEILKKMQKLTSGLVIDQVNNPGGSVFYLYSLVSMLTDQAFSTPKHRMALNPDQVKGCHDYYGEFEKIHNDDEAKKAFGESIDGYPTSYSVALAAKNYCDFIIEQYALGKKISDPFYIFGVDKINPSPVVQYTKPIVILVNELDFSGGDFFPATLQDNKRVTIIGTRTAGAGGYVEAFNISNLLGLEYFTMTGSLAERVDKNPIENLGVVPDVPLDFTLEDFRGGFKAYLTQVKKVLDEKIK